MPYDVSVGIANMLRPALTTPPVCFDEYEQPCYPTSQTKGLNENQSDALLQDALAAGYTARVARTLSARLALEVESAACGRSVDVVEIGGGYGGFYKHVKHFARSYINVEPGRLLLAGDALARLDDPKYACIKCSAEEIPLEDASVDVILSIASMDHIPDYRRALSEVRRLLRPGGMFLMTLNNRRSWWKTLLGRTAYLKQREHRIAGEHYMQWSCRECAENLREFLDVRDVRTTTFVPYIPRVWRMLLPVADGIGPVLARRRGANIIAVCLRS